jgi:hypothetical protein
MNPWQTLNADVQKDLVRPLFDLRRFESDRSDYNAWYQKWYSGVGAPPQGPPRELERYAEWRFNHRFSHEERNSFLCLYAKVKREGLWSLVKSIDWAGSHGEMVFWPTRSWAGLQQILRRRGYSDAWFADGGPFRKRKEWGLRSNRTGVELHFRGKEDNLEPVNVHIDLHNPGNSKDLDVGIRHNISDLQQRETTHTVPNLRQGLIDQGVRNVVQVP